ncbi:hypothetical protein [Actinomyces sp. oral taxon 849]|uniref:hypothetical protein n=1 Tax=Actinomyces sp. oral taxon 849 TaxID=653385 RepID=UPI000316B070|nr:hypothetical protein [Actinomyces sp. oral taxon 849]
MLLTRRGALGALSAAALTALAACGRDAGAADPTPPATWRGRSAVRAPPPSPTRRTPG